MYVERSGLTSIDGQLITIEGVRGASFEELVEIKAGIGDNRLGQVLEIEDDVAVVQVFEGTSELSLSDTSVRFTGRPLEMSLSSEILGRVFDGLGRPTDGLGPIFPEVSRDVNGNPMNPISRRYPRNFIQTGFSAIDGLITLICGQKLPIFSGSGLAHNELTVQLVRQAKITNNLERKFAIVFAAMGVKNDVASYFKESFEESGVIDHVAMFVNLANDPPVERIVTPRCALTTAEYLAFDLGMDILVIMTDMTAYCEALREISSSKGEIPSRKGFPGYMYSDLASLFERAGIIGSSTGTITQIPILTLPNDDITHPIPDLTGYITEGQIVLDRNMAQRGLYPPISVLPSLSRLMKDGIGEGFTRSDHQICATQLFSSYAKVQEIRALASVIGEEELSDIDKQYMLFGRAFENEFIAQTQDENRSIEETLDIGWRVLGTLPERELDMVDAETIKNRYVPYHGGGGRDSSARDDKSRDDAEAQSKGSAGTQNKEGAGVQSKEGAGRPSNGGAGTQSKEGVGRQSKRSAEAQSEGSAEAQSNGGAGAQSDGGAGHNDDRGGASVTVRNAGDIRDSGGSGKDGRSGDGDDYKSSARVRIKGDSSRSPFGKRIP